MNSINKLPAITISFWIMKICATTLGETAGDLLSMTLNIGYAVSSVILLSFFSDNLADSAFLQKISSGYLLGSYSFNKYSRNYYVRLYG